MIFFSKKALTKILKTGIALSVLGVLLGSALNSSSLAMIREEDKEKSPHTIISGREEVLRKYALKIIDDYNKCAPENQSPTAYQYSLYFDLHRDSKSLWEFKPLFRKYFLVLDSEHYQEELFKDLKINPTEGLKKKATHVLSIYELQTPEFFKFPLLITLSCCVACAQPSIVFELKIEKNHTFLISIAVLR